MSGERGGPGELFRRSRTVEVDGEQRPLASLLRRGAALAVDVCFAVLAAALVLDLVSFRIPLDSGRASTPILAVFGVLAFYVLWVRDRGAPGPGPSLGRRFLRLRLVPVAGPRRFARPVTVADDPPGAEDDTRRTLRAALLAVAASLAALLFMGDAVSRTTVFLAVRGHVEGAAAGGQGAAPPPLPAAASLAAIPSALLVGRTRAYVRVKAEWSGGGGGGPFEFFLERAGAGAPWEVVHVRPGGSAWMRDYSLSVPDAEVPAP